MEQPDPYPFTPVPSASTRHDGWTPERQRAFIAQLSRIGLVSAAAMAVGMSAKSAYRLRDRALAAQGADGGFLRAWRAATAAGRAKAISTAIDRAIDGVEVPYFYGGLQRATWRHYDDRLLFAVLRQTTRGHRDRACGRRSKMPTTSSHGAALARFVATRGVCDGTFVTFERAAAQADH